MARKSTLTDAQWLTQAQEAIEREYQYIARVEQKKQAALEFTQKMQSEGTQLLNFYCEPVNDPSQALVWNNVYWSVRHVSYGFVAYIHMSTGYVEVTEYQPHTLEDQAQRLKEQAQEAIEREYQYTLEDQAQRLKEQAQREEDDRLWYEQNPL